MRTKFALLAVLMASSTSLRAGELRTDEIASKAVGKTLKVNVLLPDGHGADDRRFPVVYLLHGYAGDYSQWQKIGIEKEAAGLPVILVMPDGGNSFYVNHHEDPQGKWDDYITQELIAHVDSKYRTVPERSSRAISGLSMGGYGALMLGFRHPELYAAVASHSGAVSVPGTSVQGEIAEQISKIFGPPGSETRKSYDLVASIEALPKEKRPALYLDCGSRDFLLEWNRNLVRKLSELKLDYEYREVPGGHDFGYWKANVRYSLERQLEALAKARAEKDAAPKVASPTPKGTGEIAGEWDLIVTYNEENLDYKLRIEGQGESMAAILVSPRSGEHRFEKIVWKEGALHMEILRDVGGNTAKFLYDGKLSDGALDGKVTVEGFDQFQGTWKAKRKAEEL